MGKEAPDMPSGKVKWFSALKGYGFNTAEGESKVFVHCCAIESIRFRLESLSEGDTVSLQVENGTRGRKAIKCSEAVIASF